MNKYKKHRLALYAVLLGAAPALHAATLLEVYQQALQSDPLIHEAESRRLAALEAVPQARSALLPQLSAAGQLTKANSSGRNIVQDRTGIDTLSFESANETTGWQVNLQQTVFRWDQLVSLKQAHKLVAKAEAEKEAAQQDLIVRVSQRYFDVLAAEDRLTSIRADRLAIARQLEQARQRFEVGLIAITDVQESQAAYDQSVAAEIGAKRELATASELLREITGEYVADLAAPGDAFPLPSPDPGDQASWIDLAMAQNLALVASRLDERIARDEIGFRRTGHYPTIDLVASYNDSQTDVMDQTRGGVQIPDFNTENQGDSISLQISVPLFAGGGTSSRVREAVYLHRAAREQLQRVTRETERATRDAYLGVLSEISRVNALEQAVASSRTALDATQAGFEVGTRTIVDVLNSQRALYSAITNFYQSRYVYVGNVLQLKQAAGILKVEDLEQIDQHLAPRKPPEDVAPDEYGVTDSSDQ
ncbi:MAG: TolC family outer membrane protein [Woeseia sp.]|nr:TolC family outer membrane protein [Woeseia sp.]MBT8095597.1 TolC family outer membrane protein [Woeseia sp.]NNE61233.1 TolC family outer membrane protein [Woeseia sp.]NNL53594.1 TolC family outer membrane protein [Woeseia sp.]